MTDHGMTLRKAAMIVLVGALVTTFGVPIAEFVIWPRLVDPESIEKTVLNIRANEGLFLAASFAYLVGFVGDILIAWALYYLLRPVSQSLAALAASLRAVQAVIATSAVVNLFTAYRLLRSDSFAALGADQVDGHVLVLLRSFGYGWGLALVIFGIHLCLLGFLAYRSGYIPRLVGIALAIAGVGYIVYQLRPYLYPDLEIGFVSAAFFGEVVFLVWLAIWGWRIRDPFPSAEPLAAPR